MIPDKLDPLIQLITHPASSYTCDAETFMRLSIILRIVDVGPGAVSEPCLPSPENPPRMQGGCAGGCLPCAAETSSMCLVAALPDCPAGSPRKHAAMQGLTQVNNPTSAHHCPPSRRMCACNCCFAPDKECAPCYQLRSGCCGIRLRAALAAWVEPALGSKGQLIPLVGLLQVKQLHSRRRVPWTARDGQTIKWSSSSSFHLFLFFTFAQFPSATLLSSSGPLKVSAPAPSKSLDRRGTGAITLAQTNQFASCGQHRRIHFRLRSSFSSPVPVPVVW